MSEPAPEPIIRAQNLTKIYRSGDSDLVVFADLNLEVPIGERLALVRESGAVKTTLLHIVGGLDILQAKDISGLAEADSLPWRK